MSGFEQIFDGIILTIDTRMDSNIKLKEHKN